MCGVDNNHKFLLQEILLIKMNIWNSMQEEVKKSLNFQIKCVLTNLLDHLIIFTKNMIPPSLSPKATWRCQKHNTLMKIFKFYLKQITVNGTSRFC
jgi:hypothetical protein